MKKILFIILYLCFAISLKAKLVTGTFISVSYTHLTLPTT